MDTVLQNLEPQLRNISVAITRIYSCAESLKYMNSSGFEQFQTIQEGNEVFSHFPLHNSRNFVSEEKTFTHFWRFQTKRKSNVGRKRKIRIF